MNDPNDLGKVLEEDEALIAEAKRMGDFIDAKNGGVGGVSDLALRLADRLEKRSKEARALYGKEPQLPAGGHRKPRPIAFSLSELECKRAHGFWKKHGHEDVNRGAIGGGSTYLLSPNGIGLGVTVRCDICKVEKNVTDYDSW